MLGNLFLAFVAAVAFATIVAVVAGLVLAAASAMAHDLYVGVRVREHVTPQEQVARGAHRDGRRRCDGDHHRHPVEGPERRASRGARVRRRIVGELPCVLLTLFWKRCNTGGIVAGMLIGTLTAIGLVLVSPNLTYPLAVKAAQEKIVATETANAHQIERRPCRGSDPAAQDKTRPPREVGQDQGRGGSEDQGHRQRPHVDRRPREAAVRLRNPGLVSIPLGFLAVILGSLLYRDKRSEDMWDELYVRQNTGLLLAKPAAH